MSKYFLVATFFKVLLILAICGSLAYNGLEFWNIFPYFLTLLLINTKQPLVLKNYFIFYTCLLFFIGGGFFFEDVSYILVDGYLFIIFFVAGYSIHQLNKRSTKNNNLKGSVFDEEFLARKIVVLKKLIIIFLFIRLALAVVDILQNGVSNFFSGGSLVDKIDDYGKAGFNKGLTDILNNLVSTFHIILTILYVSCCLKAKEKINFIFISLTFLAIPLLTLARSTFAFGAVTLLLIYSISLNNSGYFTKKMAFVSVLAVSSLLFVAVFIGNLRDNKLATGSSESLTVISSISGELSPIIAYDNLHKNIDALNHQWGYTIFPPLVFKIIPRSWYVDKPINSTAYYSMRFDRVNFDSGFMIPSTIFGDLYLNYGTVISMIIILFFGFWISYLDSIYINVKLSKIHIFIIIHTSFYGLIRNNLPEGLFSIIQSLIFYYLVNASVNTILKVKNIKSH